MNVKTFEISQNMKTKVGDPKKGNTVNLLLNTIKNENITKMSTLLTISL